METYAGFVGASVPNSPEPPPEVSTYDDGLTEQQRRGAGRAKARAQRRKRRSTRSGPSQSMAGNLSILSEDAVSEITFDYSRRPAAIDDQSDLADMNAGSDVDSISSTCSFFPSNREGFSRMLAKNHKAHATSDDDESEDSEDSYATDDADEQLDEPQRITTPSRMKLSDGLAPPRVGSLPNGISAPGQGMGAAGLSTSVPSPIRPTKSTPPGSPEKGLKRKVVDLTNRSLTSLPEMVLNDASVGHISLSRNMIKELPWNIDTLTGLTELRANMNEMVTLPRSLGNLVNLQTLALFSNKIKELPDTIDGLQSLEYLSVNSNVMTHLPECIGKLAKLKILRVTNNKLTALPDSVCSLVGLRTLDVDNNRLASLPADIGLLVELERLNVCDNMLEAVPPSIKNLTKLNYFNLGNNRIRSLPDAFAMLTRLQTLKLDTNSLATLPPSLCACGWLAELDVCDNMLTALPPRFGMLQRLTSLDLSVNNIQSLPPDFKDLVALTWLKLDHNPNLKVPVAIINEGPQAVVRYVAFLADFHFGEQAPPPSGCTLL